MAFGKRQSGVGAAALNVDIASTRGQATAEAAPATGSPIRWLLLCLACSWLLYAMLTSYGPDILRDHRLAGTWQPAYDLQAVEGKCERTNFVSTFCNVKIKSIARPDQAPISHSFFMLFSSGAGEALVPVRSTRDRTAVSIAYTAETKLWNRTLSFVLSLVLMALVDAAAILMFWKSVN
jgi:hypothetical protein